MDVLAPPEVTSALIYSGPGAGSLIEASGAWQQLAVELENSVAGYASALSSLIESWDGPSASAMVAAVEPYLVWLRSTAQQAQQMATSAEAAAAAFTTVRSAVVPPPVVTANRTRLAQLLATNRFGTNTAAIAQTELQYQEMWANNSAALSSYQAASAQSTNLPQFSSPLAISDPTATANQASVVPTTSAATSASVDTGVVVRAAPGRDRVRPQRQLVWTGEHLGEPVHLVRIPDQPAQLSGSVQFGPGTAGCERRSRYGPGRGDGGSAVGSRGVGRPGQRTGSGRGSRNHGVGGCRGVGGQADRAARGGRAVAGYPGSTCIGGVAASRGGVRVVLDADDAADNAAAGLRGQRLAQAQTAEVRGRGIGRRIQGQSDASIAIGGMRAAMAPQDYGRRMPPGGRSAARSSRAPRCPVA